jgi:glycerol-3-phosphate acyltransferase PlsY
MARANGAQCPDTTRLKTMETLYSAAAVLAAYLVGSLSFAVIISRLMGLNDPRSYGSGNPGATNVLRSGNKKAAVLTLIFDALKGYLPVMLVDQFGGRHGLTEGTVALVGIAAFLGHLWPVFFHFKGGKGVATAAGVLFGFNPLLGLATLLTWIIIAFFFRYSSLAAIVSAVFAPFYQLLIWGAGPIAGAVALMGLLLVWRHTANIQKLMAGTESKLGQKAPAAAAHAPPQHGNHKHGHHKHGDSHSHHGAKR